MLWRSIRWSGPNPDVSNCSKFSKPISETSMQQSCPGGEFVGRSNASMNYETRREAEVLVLAPRSLSRLALCTQHRKESTKGAGDPRRLSYHPDMGRLP